MMQLMRSDGKSNTLKRVREPSDFFTVLTAVSNLETDCYWIFHGTTDVEPRVAPVWCDLPWTDTGRRDMLHRRGDCAQFGGNSWIFAGQLVEVADFGICWHHARPLRARSQEPTTTPDYARSVKRISRDQ